MITDKSVMNVWRPGGEYWEIAISVANKDPAIIIAALSFYQSEIIKEFGRMEKHECLYCGRHFETEGQRNGHYSLCVKRRALMEFWRQP